MKNYSVKTLRGKTCQVIILSTQEDFKQYQDDIEEVIALWASESYINEWRMFLVDSKGLLYSPKQARCAIEPSNQFDFNNKHWQRVLWLRHSYLKDNYNQPYKQYWSIKSASEKLYEWLKPINKNGYGAELMILKDEEDNILGYTPYTVIDFEKGCELSQLRYPYDKLILNSELKEIKLEDLIREKFKNHHEKNIGLMLTFSISQCEEGKGYGSVLFDARIERMLELMADIILGRTSPEVPAQYLGNYLKRGMKTLATDPAETKPSKEILFVTKDGIIPRKLANDNCINTQSSPANFFPQPSTKSSKNNSKDDEIVKHLQDFVAKHELSYSMIRVSKTVYINIEKSVDEFNLDHHAKDIINFKDSRIQAISCSNNVVIIEVENNEFAKSLQKSLKESQYEQFTLSFNK